MSTEPGVQALDSRREQAEPSQRTGRLPRWRALLREDIQTIYAKDPAARSLFEVLSCYPGLHAGWLHRIGHGLWVRNHLTLARLTSHVNRFVTGIEIHPGARIGRHFFIDHGSGVVIGETAEIGDDVLMYQGAVLGGTSAAQVKRHPTIGDGVVIGANAVILGNIAVGDGAKVGSGSVVIGNVPAQATVIGVPGRITRINGRKLEQKTAGVLEHGQLPDPVVETLRCLVDRVELLEGQVRILKQSSPIDWDQEIPLSCTWIEQTEKEGQRP